MFGRKSRELKETVRLQGAYIRSLEFRTGELERIIVELGYKRRADGGWTPKSPTELETGCRATRTPTRNTGK